MTELLRLQETTVSESDRRRVRREAALGRSSTGRDRRAAGANPPQSDKGQVSVRRDPL